MELNTPPRLQSENYRSAVYGNPANLSGYPHATVEFLKYWRILSSRWKLIIGLPFAAMLGMALYSELLATTYWIGMAVITPVSSSMGADSSGMGGGALGGLADSAGGGLAALLGQGDNEMTAENYIAIMNSYDFTLDLVKRYHLTSRIIARQSRPVESMTPWDVYKQINKNFDTDYDFKTANLTLTYVDTDPSMAREVVGYYLQALQGKLRQSAVQSVTVAAQSLKAEIAGTSDTLLQQQLYQLMAQQIQQGKLAQVQADFAFKVIEPPMVPGTRYSPRVAERLILTGMSVGFLVCLTILLKEWLRHGYAHLDALESGKVPLTETTGRQEHTQRSVASPLGGERMRQQL